MSRSSTLDGNSQSPGRVAVVAYSEYEYDIRIRNEAEALAEAGHRVHVVSVMPKTGAADYQFDGITLHRVPLHIRRGGRLRYVYQYTLFFLMSTVVLVRLHRKSPFGFVHVHTLPDFQVFCAVPLKITGTKVILDMHEPMPEILAARFGLGEQSALFRITRFLELLSCRFADQLIAASEGIRDAVVSKGVPLERFLVVYNSGDRAAAGMPPEPLRQRLRIPQQRLLVHAGSVNPERDLETLLRALSAPQLSDFHLVVAGEGEPAYIQSLSKLAAQLGISNRVHFTGNLSVGDARSLMSMSEVGIVTLQRNALTDLAWPMRIVEYANMEKQLVVPELRFIREVLGPHAYYYRPQNPASLAATISDALADSRSGILNPRAPWTVCSRFRWELMRPILLSAFRPPSPPVSGQSRSP